MITQSTSPSPTSNLQSSASNTYDWMSQYSAAKKISPTEWLKSHCSTTTRNNHLKSPLTQELNINTVNTPKLKAQDFLFLPLREFTTNSPSNKLSPMASFKKFHNLIDKNPRPSWEFWPTANVDHKTFSHKIPPFLK